MSIGVFYGTIRVIEWAMGFAEAHPEMDGVQMAAVIAAVLLPFSTMQSFVLKFQFDSLTWKQTP